MGEREKERVKPNFRLAHMQHAFIHLEEIQTNEQVKDIKCHIMSQIQKYDTVAIYHTHAKAYIQYSIICIYSTVQKS